jgi:arsenate reductase
VKARDRIAIDVLVSDGCPHADAALDLVRRVAWRVAPQAIVSRIEVGASERAVEAGFLGPPSIRVNGRDIEGSAEGGSLTCRTHDSADLPPEWMIEAAIARALEPTGILFLCVANSARSQMAEGIARSLAPPEVRIWSAGSQPKAIKAEAIAVLREIEVDIAGQRSKAVADIPASQVDLVITLCAGEACPVFLGNAVHLHWGLSDPAAVDGSDDERLTAFRGVRDELRRRITLLLAG